MGGFRRDAVHCHSASSTLVNHQARARRALQVAAGNLASRLLFVYVEALSPGLAVTGWRPFAPWRRIGCCAAPTGIANRTVWWQSWVQ
jgi:hypothetical protein